MGAQHEDKRRRCWSMSYSLQVMPFLGRYIRDPWSSLYEAWVVPVAAYLLRPPKFRFSRRHSPATLHSPQHLLISGIANADLSPALQAPYYEFEHWAIYGNVQAVVRMPEGLTDKFPSEMGVEQGCPLSAFFLDCILIVCKYFSLMSVSIHLKLKVISFLTSVRW